MATMRVQGKRLIVSGAVGYEATSEFSKSCHEFMAGAGRSEGMIDLGGVTELVSSGLATIYDAARLHGPSDLTLVVPERLALLFAPGEVEGLFTVKTASPTDKSKDRS